MQSNCLGDKILCRVVLGLEVSTLDSHLNWNLPLTSWFWKEQDSWQEQDRSAWVGWTCPLPLRHSE
jgi:hypothetical protein